MKKIIISSICSSLFLATLFSTSVNALIEETYSVTHNIGTDTTLTQISGLNNSSPQKVNIIEYKPNSDVSPVVVYNEKIYGSRMTITAARDYLTAKDEYVIAGTNGDYYGLSTGVPSGLVMVDGEMMCSDSWQYAVGFYEDGSAFIAKPNILTYFNYPNGSSFISYYNKVRTTSGLYLLDENFHTNTTNGMPGYDIILEELDENPIAPGVTKTLQVVDIVYTSNATALTEGQMVITLRDEISDQLPDVSVGDVATLTTSTFDTRWNNVQYAIGGYQLLLKDGVMESGLSTSVDPRTAIGIKADGTVVLYQVDGRQSGYSTGLSLQDVAKELLALGCVDALNLDGGGSSGTIATLPGYDSATVQNSSSESSLRSNANYLMFVNNESPTGVLRNLHIYTEDELMLVNATTSIDVKGTDSNYYSLEATDYTLYANDEVLYDNFFTATEPGSVQIEAIKSSTIRTAKTITVLDRVDTISVYNTSGTEISSISTKPGNQVQLDVEATHNYISVTSSNTSFTYTVTGDIGSIDENGLFTATNSLSSGKIIISYQDNSFKEIAVSVGLDKESAVFLLDTELFTSDSAEVSHYLPDNKPFDQNGLEVTSELNCYIETTPIAVDGYSYLNATIDGDYSLIYAVYTDVYLDEYLAPLETINYSKVTSTKIPTSAEYFVGFYIEGSGETTLENISLSDVFNDLEVPIITINNDFSTSVSSISTTGKITKNSLSVVDKSNILVYLNNESINFTYDEFSGEIYISSSNLINGINKLTVTVYDNFGNLNTTSVSVTSNSASSSIFVDTSDHWAKNYVNFSQTLGFVSGQSVNDTMYFYPDNNITRAEFAMVIYKYLGLETTDNITEFTDNADIPTWALNAVYAVSDAGLMNGSLMSDGTIAFNPMAYITRAEAFAVIGRFTMTGNVINETEFTDNEQIPSWAQNSFNILSTYNILKGYTDGTVKPLNSITRAEVCTLLFSLS